MLKSLIRDESGASLAEYALLLGIISIAVVTAVTTLRDSIVATFDGATSALAGGTAPVE